MVLIKCTFFKGGFLEIKFIWQVCNFYCQCKVNTDTFSGRCHFLHFTHFWELQLMHKHKFCRVPQFWHRYSNNTQDKVKMFKMLTSDFQLYLYINGHLNWFFIHKCSFRSLLSNITMSFGEGFMDKCLNLAAEFV